MEVYYAQVWVGFKRIGWWKDVYSGHSRIFARKYTDMVGELREHLAEEEEINKRMGEKNKYFPIHKSALLPGKND